MLTEERRKGSKRSESGTGTIKEFSSANEENIAGVDLDVFLVRMLTATLRRNVAVCAFNDFQERLLNAFA